MKSKQLNTFSKLKHKEYQILHFLLINALVIAVLVYLFGGTKNVYMNLMYIPISLAAIITSRKYALIFAIICGLLVGPFMPLDTDLHLQQSTYSWLLRLGVFVIISLMISSLSNVIMKSHSEVLESQLATLFALIKLTEMRDGETGEHVERIVEYMKVFLERLEESPKYKKLLSNTSKDCVARASALHDIGKIGVSDTILLKSGKLTEEEFSKIKEHTTIGSNTLKELKTNFPDNDFINAGLDIVKYHHERWDGKGYPDGIKGEEIPLTARIVSIIDVYDALRSSRVYKESLTHADAIALMIQGRFTQFDGDLLDVFVKYELDFKNIYETSNYHCFDIR